MADKFLVVIAGPTAVGKTDLCIQLAKELDTEIISADSRQFYKEMSIGTAKPTNEELSAAPHHLINSHSIYNELSAGEYELEALKLIEKLFFEKDILILTGGSGLYINAVTDGFDEMPEVEVQIRAALNLQLEQQGLESLLEELQKKDPAYYAQVDRSNPRRVLRAIEVIRASGNKYSDIRKGSKKYRSFRVIKIALERPREELYQRINDRVDIMIEKGLLEEVKSLYEYRNFTALKTVGYSEIIDHLDGKVSLEEAIELIKRNTRRYAKRQLTWFRRDNDFHWYHPDNMEQIVKFVKKQIQP